MSAEEQRLIDAAIAGDSAAFESLISPLEGRIYAVALRMCGNREDAQDCMQEAMIRIYRALNTFKGQSSLSTWAHRITMNTCLDELRRRKSRASTSLDELADSGWAPHSDNDTPEHRTIRSEQKRTIERAISELPEDMRAAIILRDIHGLTYDEIADSLNVNVGTVKSRISRGRERLRSKLSAHPELFDR